MVVRIESPDFNVSMLLNIAGGLMFESKTSSYTVSQSIFL